ncbi:protease [Paenibacillus thermotolerans]|uniref:protease n=1 Tax=Paenibacillus thermotolerans TaxID=3027807 RepID=UPI002368C9E9|nr:MULTISPECIES: protease [unclassified Paenibacillus]
MIELYWFCFIAGAVTAVAFVLIDNVAGGWIDGLLDFLPDFLNPTSVMSGIVVFGGAGILLTQYSSLQSVLVAALSLLSAVFVSIVLFFFYVKPMSEAESSIAYSITELPGKIGEVTIPIPKQGYGEAAFTFGHGNVYAIAESAEQTELSAGEKVLAIDVKDQVVRVCRWTESM